MVKTDTAPGKKMRGEQLGRSLHILALSSVAVMQPLFGVLGGEPQFWIARRAGLLEVFVFVAALVAIPLVLAGVGWVLTAAARPVGNTYHSVAIATLIWALLVPITDQLTGRSQAAFQVIVVAAVVAGLLVIAYWRVSGLRLGLSYLVAAPVVFVVVFIAGLPPIGEARGPFHDPGILATDTSVAVIVLDELSTAALLDSEGEIDGERFPNFHRLASTSTFYRHAHTVSASTLRAIPALLSGQFPTEDKLGSSLDFPTNLFTVMSHTHQLEVFENLTRMCPRTACGSQLAGTRFDEIRLLITDASVVYLHTVVPETARRWLPPIGTTWKGFLPDRLVADPPEAGGLASDLAMMTGGGVRAVDFGQFLDLVSTRTEPTVFYYHLELPHPPWEHLADGSRYPFADWIDGLDFDGWWSDESAFVRQAFQRFEQQLRFTDVLVGLFLDSLELSGKSQDTLTIVTADHGLNFEPGQSRRGPTPETVGSLASVPLFVRYPGQTVGLTDTRVVTIVDLLPTVMDVLEARHPLEADGRSLLTHPGLGSADQLEIDEVTTSIGWLLAQAAEDLRRYVDFVGRRDGRGWIPGGPLPELIGRRVETFERRSENGRVSLEWPELYQSPAAEGFPVRNFIRANVHSVDTSTFAVSINGVVWETARSYLGVVTFLVPPEAFRSEGNKVVVHGLETLEDSFVLVDFSEFG